MCMALFQGWPEHEMRKSVTPHFQEDSEATILSPSSKFNQGQVGEGGNLRYEA